MKDKNDIYEFLKLHKEKFYILILGLVCFFLYFFQIGNIKHHFFNEGEYLLITKNMFSTGDYLNLYLNGEVFFEKPPLFFWIENLFFNIFNDTGMHAARIPSAISATAGVFLIYIYGRKIISPAYGLISALILATNFGYIIHSKVAVFDMFYAVCLSFGIFSGFYTIFCNQKLKKYFWWIAYIFTGFCVLTKGISAVVIPLISMFTAYATAGRVKEIFKPVYILPGAGMFCLIVLPWHMIMMHTYKDLFFNEYVFKKIGFIFENHPHYFSYCFMAFFIFYSLPWIFSFIAEISIFFSRHRHKIKSYFYKFNELKKYEQFLFINAIYIFILTLAFSISEIKFPSMLLPLFFPASLITGKFWYDYISKNKKENKNEIGTEIAANISTGALIVTLGYIIFLRKIAAGLLISADYGILFLTLITLGAILAIITKNRKAHFIIILIFSILIAACR